MCVMFTRVWGMLDDLGGGGSDIQADGTFEHDAQPGRYRLSVWEMTPPTQEGSTQMTKQVASMEVVVGSQELDGIEIQVSPTTTGRD
jgi:hypothetical protein